MLKFNKTTKYIIIVSFLVLIIANACQQNTSTKSPEVDSKAEKASIAIPEFNADSAYSFVKAQTDFGPRAPGSTPHKECAEYLVQKLKSYTPHVTVQAFKSRAYNSKVLSGKNIIASFLPEKRARIMLAAHWDSRPFADHDADTEKHNQPIDGANDGASGVGILLEVARLLQHTNPAIGVDIVFFDLEDYGPPSDAQNEGSNEAWGLGSQYWSKNPHKPNYKARFVILLDMVGATGARFKQEGFSMHFAPDKVKKVWDIAHELGYQEYFLNEQGGYINDDHYFINEMANIPAIDIIHLDSQSSNGSFFEHWHTSGDSIDKIDKNTLGVVGRVVVVVIFKEK